MRSLLAAAGLIAMALYLGVRGIAPPAPERLRVAVIAAEAYDGALMVESDVEDQARRAGIIVVGRVAKTQTKSIPGSVETTVTVDVERALKGTAGTTVTFTLPGGGVGSLHVFASGVPNFLPGERVLLFMRGPNDPRLVQMWQSKFSLAGNEAVQLESKTRMPIADMERRVGNVTGRTAFIGASSDTVSVIGFTTFCLPWKSADLPVPFEVTSANPGAGGATGVNFTRLAYDSWHNWQALPDSFPSFRYTGTATHDPNNHSDGFNTVSYADLDTWGTGTIGINWCTTNATERIDSDTFIDNTGWTWDWDDSDGISAGTLAEQSTMEHELGHGLSLDHSNATCDGTAATPLMCPVVMTGQRKIILADDQAGAAANYPLSGASPGAPGSVAVTAGSGSNTVQWTASSGTPFAYDLERSGTGCGGPFKSIGTAQRNVTSFVDNDFGAGLGAGPFCYRMKALGQGGDSPYSNLASVGGPSPTPTPTRTPTPTPTSTRTPTPTATATPAVTAPGAPTITSLVALDSSTIRVNWTFGSPPGTEVHIESARLYQPWLFLAADAASPFDHTGLQPNTTYCYRAVAHNHVSGLLSAYSNWICVATLSPGGSPGAPTITSLVALDSSTIRVNWTSGSPPGTEVHIESAQLYQPWLFLAADAASPFDHTGLQPNTTYCYRAVAHDHVSGLLSAYSNWTCVTTLAAGGSPGAPSISVVPVDSSTIRVNWTSGSPPGTEVHIESAQPYQPWLFLAADAASPFDHTGLQPNTSYCYRAIAHDHLSGLLSAYSNWTCVATLP